MASPKWAVLVHMVADELQLPAAHALWMRALYESRLGGADTAAAMQQAGLAMLRERRAAGLTTHPFYWAAFVAAGDWR